VLRRFSCYGNARNLSDCFCTKQKLTEGNEAKEEQYLKYGYDRLCVLFLRKAGSARHPERLVYVTRLVPAYASFKNLEEVNCCPCWQAMLGALRTWILLDNPRLP